MKACIIKKLMNKGLIKIILKMKNLNFPQVLKNLKKIAKNNQNSIQIIKQEIN